MAYGFDESPRIPVELKAGGVVFFNGYLLYQSLKNRTETGYRRVPVNHYLSCESLLPWTDVREGGPVARADICRVFPVAGVAPYAWKGNRRRTPPTPAFTFVKPPVPEQQPEALSANRPQSE